LTARFCLSWWLQAAAGTTVFLLDIIQHTVQAVKSTLLMKLMQTYHINSSLDQHHSTTHCCQVSLQVPRPAQVNKGGHHALHSPT
jgi:hypothetical protein